VSQIYEAARKQQPCLLMLGPTDPAGLAQLAEAQDPFPTVAVFLQTVAAGQPLPPMPTDLSKPLDEILNALVGAIPGDSHHV
jgi:hypothetical protein